MEKDRAKQKICQYIEDHREDLIHTLQTVVRIPTLVGQEGEGQRFMQDLYAELGLKVISFEADYEKVSKHKAFVESGFKFEGRPNIIGIFEGQPSARSLILNGHIDIVSPEPISEWKHHPWSGEVVDGRLYGRGACDMKGGLIANYFALKSLLDTGLKPRGTVILQSVIEEEAGGGGGTLACLLEGFTADGMVIPEPFMKITVASTGVYYFRVRVVGKTAHAGSAHTGINAIGKMNKIYDKLVSLDEKRAREKHYPLFEKDSERSCHLNVGTYRAGDWPSTVAGWAEIECRMSTIPGESAKEIRDQVTRVVMEVAQSDEWMRDHPPRIEWFGWQADPWEQDPNDPFVTTFKASAERVTSREIDIVGKTAGLDTRFAQYFGMPALTFGPDGENIHGIDEFVNLDSLVECTKVLASFIVDWCDVQ